MGRDFNDMGAAGAETLNEPQDPPSDCPDPEPLNAPDDAIPYPLDSLPDGIREAVEEVLSFTQSPPALAACSALSALSLAGQGLSDVRRDKGLVGPVSLYFLPLAGSGERKSSIDNHFTSKIREWEQSKREEAAPLIKQHRADYAAWEAERAGLLTKIKNKPSVVLRNQLREHEKEEPQEPRIPQPLHHDSTPEALSWSLAHRWPSGAILSSEAGVVFGGHAMGSDSVVRNLALLNILWDGGTVKIDRRSTGMFVVQGARITLGLSTQISTIKEFIKSAKGLARGSGFLARFLIANPESTQGTRFWKDAPQVWPHLTKFQNRLIEMLERTPSPDGDRGLEPPVLDFSRDGREAWISTYNIIEADLAPGGDLESLRDLASKAADNIARLSALFTLYKGDLEIDPDSVKRASILIAWHLHEAKRFFGEIQTSQQDMLAAKLDAWLLSQEKSRIPRSEILTHGPNPLRKKENLDKALSKLFSLNRVRIVPGQPKTILEINPRLFRGRA